MRNSLFLILIVSFLSTILSGKKFIKLMSRWQGKGQPIRDDGPDTHLKKAGTPTMGGILIIGLLLGFSLVIPATEIILPVLFITTTYSCIGFLDDYAKVKKQNVKGIGAKTRLVVEFIIAGVALYYINPTTTVRIPIFNTDIDMGYLYYLFTSIIIVGSANATNLTDGLDGLLAGTSLIVLSTLVFIMFIVVNDIIGLKQYVSIGIDDIYSLMTLCTTFIGILLGFLWFNSNPARIFMGDVGSLAIGGFIGTTAVILKQELLLVVIGGVFVAEALSVIIQVASYKSRKKRVFLMAPIHHHFEKLGIAENTVVMRFWIVNCILCAFSLWLIFM
jgi:phospho-N-acetylmuramoyl-pentapeptide-transferase